MIKLKHFAILIFVVAALFPASVAAAEYDGLLSSMLDGRFLGQELKGKRTGMGALQKGQNMYFGDFKAGKYHGVGILIQPDNKLMTKCMNAKVYVGEWEEGKKCGEGRLYDVNGNQIYHGRFEKDLPVAVINDGSPERSFGVINNGKDIKIGERVGNKMLGQSIVISDGGFIISEMEDDEPVGIRFEYPNNGMWTVMYSPYPGHKGRWVSSLEVYQKIDGDRNQRNSALWAEAKQEFKKALDTGMTLAGDIAGVQSGDGDDLDLADDGTATGATKSGKNKKASAKDKDNKQINGTAWKAKQRAYSDYETQLIKMKSDAKSFDLSHYRDIQRKMKNIRKELESKGLPITKSPHEDDNP